jgi:hypothetical protein
MLARARPGMLTGLVSSAARWSACSTGGMISSLTHLVRGAAIRAILGGQEALIRLAQGRARGAVSYG